MSLPSFVRYYIQLTLCLVSAELFSQDRFSKMKQELELLKMDVPALDEKIEISVDEIELEEFIRSLAVSNKLNVNVDPSLNAKVSNHFSDVTLCDILLFLAQEHDLDITLLGNIINITKHYESLPLPEPPPQQPAPVTYLSDGGLLSLDLRDYPLYEVLKLITRESGKNVIASSGIENMKVNSFMLNVPFESAVEKFATSNNLVLTIAGDGFYVISKQEKTEATAASENKDRKKQAPGSNELFEYQISEKGLITVKAEKQPISDIIKAVAIESGINFYMLSEPKGSTSINLDDFTFDDFLTYIFKASDHIYKKIGGIYIIGERAQEQLRETKVIELQHRSIKDLTKQIPKEISEGVSMFEFTELNSLILSGSAPSIAEIEKFLLAVDKVVPVVLIEVMIIDYNRSHTVSMGINAGIGTQPAAKSSGQFYPTVDYNMNAGSVNSLIESLNGFGWFKLGKVTPNFYFQIQALEDQGVLKIRSTPRLATLNGNEASLSIGNTEYYMVETNQVIGTQNPQNIVTRKYESVRADLTVTIKPFVSGDEHITLEITVTQSDFTARISPNAPPGSVSRSFKSLIRVKNEELILLGGLEEKTVSHSGSGLPLLSRIPVLKWLFGSRTRTKKHDKLNIFIKPTVFY